MPLSITLRRAADAFGVQGPAAARRLKGLPYTKSTPTGRGGRQHIFPLAAVLPRVTRPEHIGPLFRAATDDSSLYVGSGPEVMQMADDLDGWLTPAMRARYGKVRGQMLAGLSAARGGAAFLPMIENLNRKVLLHSDVLRHVVLGVPNQVAFGAFAPAFALVNAAAEPDTVFIDSTRPELGEWRMAA